MSYSGKTNWVDNDVVVATDMNRIEQGITDVDTSYAAHAINYSLHPVYGGSTTNSGNAYSIATPAITSLTAGMAIAVLINADSTGAATLNWSSRGAKNIVRPNGTAVSNLKSGGLYVLRYNGTSFVMESSDGEADTLDGLHGGDFVRNSFDLYRFVATDGSNSNTGVGYSGTGTVTISASSTTVTGSGTAFTTQLSAGGYIAVEGEIRKIQTIASATSLTVTVAFGLAHSAKGFQYCNSPKLTIQNALDSLPRFLVNSCDFYIARGTYAETVTVTGFAGPGNLTIYGGVSLADSANHVIAPTSGKPMTIGNNATCVAVIGLKFSIPAGTYNRVHVFGSVKVIFIWCTADGNSYTDTNRSGFSVENATVRLYVCAINNVSGSEVYHGAVSASSGGVVCCESLSGSGNNIVLKAAGGTIMKDGNGVPTGTTAESCLNGGMIFGAVTTLPGNTSYTTPQLRNVVLSTSDPSGGSNGDIWIKYQA